MVLYNVRGRLEYVNLYLVQQQNWKKCDTTAGLNFLSLLLSMYAYVPLFICAIHSGVSSGFQ